MKTYCAVFLLLVTSAFSEFSGMSEIINLVAVVSSAFLNRKAIYSEFSGMSEIIKLAAAVPSAFFNRKASDLRPIGPGG